MSHRHPDIPHREGGSATGRYCQNGAERRAVLAPPSRTPLIHLEPHLDAVAASGASPVLHPVLRAVHRAYRVFADFPAACMEFDNCVGCQLDGEMEKEEKQKKKGRKNVGVVFAVRMCVSVCVCYLLFFSQLFINILHNGLFFNEKLVFV